MANPWFHGTFWLKTRDPRTTRWSHSETLLVPGHGGLGGMQAPRMDMGWRRTSLPDIRGLVSMASRTPSVQRMQKGGWILKTAVAGMRLREQEAEGGFKKGCPTGTGGWKSGCERKPGDCKTVDGHMWLGYMSPPRGVAWDNYKSGGTLVGTPSRTLSVVQSFLHQWAFDARVEWPKALGAATVLQHHKANQ